MAALRDVTPAAVGSIPTTHPNIFHPLVAEQADAPVSEAGARGACPFDSDRGDQANAR